MSGTLFWAVVPIVIFSLFWVANEDPSLMARNITLGFIGAALGASALIWLGYLARDWSATAGQYTKAKETVVAQGAPTINTWNQSGGTNTIIVGPITNQSLI